MTQHDDDSMRFVKTTLVWAAVGLVTVITGILLLTVDMARSPLGWLWTAVTVAEIVYVTPMLPSTYREYKRLLAVHERDLR
jgi:cell division protein FtsW (lipid II flippase)